MSACIDPNQNPWDAQLLFLRYKCLLPIFPPFCCFALCMNPRILNMTVTLWEGMKKMQATTKHHLRRIVRTTSSCYYLTIASKLPIKHQEVGFFNVRPQRVLNLTITWINTCIQTLESQKWSNTYPGDHKSVLLSRSHHKNSDVAKLLRTKTLGEYQTSKVVPQQLPN